MAEQLSAAGSPVATKRPSRLFGRFLVKERFQYKYALLVGFFLGVATLCIWYLGQVAVNQLISTDAIRDPIAIEQLHNLNSLIFKISIIFLATALFVSLLFSHLIAGPIYRFEKTFEEVRDGNLTVFIKLRKRDEFKETAELFNQALASLRRRIQKERDVVIGSTGKLSAMVGQLRSAGRNDEANALEGILHDLRNSPPQVKI